MKPKQTNKPAPQTGASQRPSVRVQRMGRTTALRVYKIEGWGNYGGGIVIAAATSAEEAAKIGNAESSGIWSVEFKAADAVELRTVKAVTKKAGLIAHFETGE